LNSANPIPVNVSQLQTASAFLGSQNVTAGTYTSLSLTFANPQMTIFNASDSALSSTCAVGNVCQLTPTVTPLTLSFSSAPFPITVTANSPLGLKLDIHLDTVIQSDLSVNLAATSGVTLSQMTPPQPGGPIPALGMLTGTVQTPGTNQFTLQTLDGRTLTIEVNSSTTYSGFPSSACSAQGFSCLATGQTVNVTVSLQSDGSLLATAVDYLQLPTQQTVEGNIIGLSTSGGNTIMDLVIQQQPAAANASVLPVGRHAAVTVPTTGVTYAVDSDGFALPSGLTFASAADLQVGQNVLVVVQGTVTQSTSSGTSSSGTSGSSSSGSSGSGGPGPGNPSGPEPVGPPNVSFTASSVTLEPSQITGTVASVTASSLSFTLSTMPVFFVPPSPSGSPGAAPTLAPVTITVQTTSATTYSNFTTNSISGLAANDVVSVHGWVFSTSAGVTVAADSVLNRPGPTPLF
jgi:hypothetical protein